MNQSSTFALCLRCVPEQQFLPGKRRPHRINSYDVTQREPDPHAESHVKAASDSTASPNAAVSALISSFSRRSLGENG
jgi:hypothetical protein